jgi:hypothetical protein
MYTYIYFYKSDSSKEPIGRVKADTLELALQQITVIKKLNKELIENILVIQKLD